MATIVLPAEKVIKAAEGTIASIMAKRKARDEEAIASIMANSFESKFFFFKGLPVTRERAIEKLRQDTWGSYPSRYAWGDLDHAKKLLHLAKHGDPVTLNEEDARVLF